MILSENSFPEWQELNPLAQQVLLASGFNEAIYSDADDMLRSAMLWKIPWAELDTRTQLTFGAGGIDEENYEATRLTEESVLFCMGLEPRVALSEDMRAIIAVGEELEYNRQLAEWVPNGLEYDGIHILQPVLVHRHIAFEVTDPHMRAHAYLRIAGQDEAVEGIVDIRMDIFNRLETTSVYGERHGIKLEGEWDRFVRDFWAVVEESGGPEAHNYEALVA